jgi:hypothetical protein
MELAKTDDRVKPVVLFATPTFDKAVSVDFLTSMLGTVVELTKHGIEWSFRSIAGNQFIDLARNELVDYFLKSPEGFTDLVFIDADQGWDPKVVPRILRYAQPVVAALPPKKCDPPTFHSNAITGRIENGLFQALEAGTGFMRIKREVFERMDKAFPALAALREQDFGWPHTPYFQSGNTIYGRLGEDIFFCRQLVAMGEFLWIDSDVTFTHRGSKAWKGNFYEHCVNTGLLKKSA